MFLSPTPFLILALEPIISHCLSYVKVLRKLLPTLTSSALQELLDIAKKLERNSHRNQAILLLLIDVALRPGELLSLT